MVKNIKKNSQCLYWPPEGTAKHIADFVKKKHSPQADWILYHATLLGNYGKIYIRYSLKNFILESNIL